MTKPYLYEEFITALLADLPPGPQLPPVDWQSLAGSITPADLQLMSEAIEAGCGQVDLKEG